MLGESYLIFLFKIFNLDLSILRVSFLFEIKLTNPLLVKRIVTFLKWTAFRVLSVPSIVQTHVIFLPSLHPSLIFRSIFQIDSAVMSTVYPLFVLFFT